MNLEQFQGPIELLLYLIQQQELDITEVPIARITDVYLSQIQALESLNIENAAEFLLMAVVLIRMKMRSLLPRPEAEALDTGTAVSMDEIRAEFARYQEAANRLSRLENERRSFFPRAGARAQDLPGRGDVMILTEAFQAVLKKLEPKQDWVVERVQLRIEETLTALRAHIRDRQVVDFLQYLSGMRQLGEIIIAFLAALELVRLGEIRVSQDDETGSIFLFYRHAPVVAWEESQ